MIKSKISLIILVIAMVLESFSIQILDYKNKTVSKQTEQYSNNKNITKEFNIDNIEAYSNVFNIEEMSKVNQNVYLCYNVKGTIKECLCGVDYYVKEGCKIEDLTLEILDGDQVYGKIKMSF